jgi:predicted nucleic acid-binding protein
MILLDSTALVATFLGEPAAQEVESLLREGDGGITGPNLAEVIDVLVRVFGNDLEAVEARLVPLLATTLSVTAVGEAEGRRAAEIRIRQYHRRDNPLSLADCLLLGTALVLGAAVATSDVPLARSARSEGLEVIALRDSAGKKPWIG